MSFIDKVQVSLMAGKGGDGRRSFRHERFIAKGGPDGGDGGNGGSIIFQAKANQNTLARFRHKKVLLAENGQPGGKSRKHGRFGQDLIVDVPVGTQISDLNGTVLADLVSPTNKVVIAKGGRGGFGNAHFKTSIRQAPNFAEKGEPGQKLDVWLELKLIADVAIIGLPNAGKSTLLARLSNARPEIADYPFTTLTPNLGVVDVDNQTSILLADIPGLIEGAASGKGLGHEFLRHIERTKLIVHVIDIYQEDIVKTYQTIRQELAAYSLKLTKLPEIVAINKIDGYDLKLLDDKLAKLKKSLNNSSKLVTISAQAGINLDELKFKLKDRLNKQLKPKYRPSTVLPRIILSDSSQTFSVIKEKVGYRVIGPKIERFGLRTDFNNDQSVDRLKNILKRMGIIHELIRQGIQPGDQIIIGQDNNNRFIY